ncbi:hypothetical protein KR067_006250, partial [Drosophila pandora]
LRAVVTGPEIVYNKDSVSYLGYAPGQSQVIMINVTRLVKTVFMDNCVENEDTNRVSYRVQNFSVCNFLNNRLISKLFSNYYEEFVGNTTDMKCPIRPGIYYLTNSISNNSVPSFHPSGNYRFLVNIKTDKEAPYSAKFVWRYRVTRS